jgi:hypothetical protein
VECQLSTYTLVNRFESVRRRFQDIRILAYGSQVGVFFDSQFSLIQPCLVHTTVVMIRCFGPFGAEKSKDAAIAAWATKWHQSPHTSKAYQTALTTPPDGKPHHTFHAARAHTRTDETPPDKFSRLTHSTLYRFITGHAFTGEYTRRFFPQHTQEQIACQCGEPLQTIEHVLLHCPLYTAARRRHLTVSGRPRSFPQLLENPERVQSLLRFLEETKACNKPRAEWEPG